MVMTDERIGLNNASSVPRKKMLYITPTLHYPMLGGQYLRVYNVIKALNGVVDLDILFLGEMSGMGGEEAINHLSKYCNHIYMYETRPKLYKRALRQVFKNIQKEYEESALLDGAGRPVIIARIIVPNAGPAFAAVAIFNFQGVWNDFLQPLIFLHDHSRFTVALGLNFFRSSYNVQWAHMMAASVAALLPVICVFLYCQKLFIKGISVSGLKY